MRSPLRASILLGGGSALSILAAVVSAKAWALILGPGGYGQLALWQALVKLTGLIAGLGIGTGIVRFGSGSVNQRPDGLAHWRRAAWALAFALGGAAAALMIVFRRPLAGTALPGSPLASAMPWAAVATLATVVYGAQTGILNAYHHVGALAKITALGSWAGAITGIAIVAVWREAGIPAAVLAGAGAYCLVAQLYLRRRLPAARAEWSWQATAAAMRSLLRFGLPYTLAMAAGTGAQLAMPFVVLWALGTESVGFYRAASAIAVSYLTLVLTALAQDYFPRLSAVREDASALVAIINEQNRVILLLALPLILLMLAVAPLLMPLLYSGRFAPAIVVLEWQLAGDVLKVASWIMSFAILARCKPSWFLLTEFVGGAGLLASGWLGMRWLGLVGVGLAFPATYALYYMVCHLLIRRSVKLVWTPFNVRLLVLGLAAVLAVELVPQVLGPAWRTPLAACLTVAAFGVSLRFLPAGGAPAGWRGWARTLALRQFRGN